MRVGLIVAGAPHLKTEQIATALVSEGNYQITIVTVPFKTRKPRSPLFVHRPDQSDSIPLDQLARGLGIELVETETIDEFDPSGFDVFLMTGGVLLPESFLDRADGKVLNCHPGLIPQTRGLDAFKWAIHEGNAVGNTLHYISGDVDMGRLLYREITPVFESDTLDTFARRHYEAEIRILAKFERYMSNEEVPAENSGPVGERHLRMKAELEKALPEAFDTYKQRFSDGD